MLYQRKRMEVNAVKLRAEMTVGQKTGQPGDYLVTFEDDSMGIVTAKVFEASFEPAMNRIQLTRENVENVLTNLPPVINQPTQPEPQPTGYICVGCGSDSVPENMFDKNTGMCADCLKKFVVCQTCGNTVQQFEVVGSYCRRCLSKPA